MRLKYIGAGLALAGAGLFAIPAAKAASPSVAAAETIVNMTAAVMHTQYHENFPDLPDGTPTGDDESGYSPGFGIAASALLPMTRNPVGPDLYTSFAYDFSAGNIDYNGHYVDGAPTMATDNTVFNRIETRIGIGFPLIEGAEAIPFIAVGYQSWNRNINQQGIIGTDEFYHSGLAGGGIKFDIPIGDRFVVSATGEVLGLFGGGISFNNFSTSGTFGPSAEERVALGLDYAASRRFHVLGSFYWENFNYSGSQPKPIPDLPGYVINEPLSVTTQFGANLGIGYSFN